MPSITGELTEDVVRVMVMFRKTFSCPRIKSYFVTGKSTAELSPEDIGIIAALGDALSVSCDKATGDLRCI